MSSIIRYKFDERTFVRGLKYEIKNQHIRKRMFTGIVESLATIQHIETLGTNKEIWLTSSLRPELKVDQSVLHNGICLTVDALDADRYRVTAIDTTIRTTTLGMWKVGQQVNIERSQTLNSRLDGHIVQGHVDGVLSCIDLVEHNGSYTFTFRLPQQEAHLVIEKGSVTLEGISLTCHSVTSDSFSVSIIPYTWEHTIAHTWQIGSKVNVEWDVIGKYIARMLKPYTSKAL